MATEVKAPHCKWHTKSLSINYINIMNNFQKQPVRSVVCRTLTLVLSPAVDCILSSLFQKGYQLIDITINIGKTDENKELQGSKFVCKISSYGSISVLYRSGKGLEFSPTSEFVTDLSRVESRSFLQECAVKKVILVD